ncbi:hypothetical protein LEQ04_11820 [Riemerella anatipestifer]|nr:hypothetical protein LEQ05_02535 [Riemerella anatipestifer]WPC13060.1 hypothetical protein LEQ03_13120 [Riemerella anatipestifer]WPC15128.1 hypothetical protein LEQ04_11820 [Riemerella anatipestifer]
MEEINKLGGLGASEIGALFTQQGLKAKTAQTLAYEKALELILGQKNILQQQQCNTAFLMKKKPIM